MSLLLSRIFGRKSDRRLSKKRRHDLCTRDLRLESLEQRQLLTAVTLTPVKDNSIFSGFTSNSDGQGGLYIGLNNSLDNIKRSLLEFDIASVVPAGATINSVSLSMYCYRNRNGGAATAELHKLNKDWGEGTSNAGETSHAGQGASASANDATWLKPFFGQSATWTTAGGDFSSTISGSTALTGPNGTGSYTWASTAQMVADVQSWLNNPSANFGWMLKASTANESANTSHAFYSREWTTVAQRPTLTINYTAAAHQNPTLDAIADPAAVNENAGAQAVNLTGITAGAGQSEALSVSATSSNTALIPNPAVSYTSPNATGSLSYTPVANSFGSAVVTVTVHNAGVDGTLGTADDGTVTRTFTVNVTHVNQTPTLDAIADPAAINENAAAQTVNLTGITAGPGDSQTLQVTATSDNTGVIPNPSVTYTSPNATGSISYTPVANTFGTAHVTVTVRDAGLDGTMGNADDATFSRTFTVTVNHVNQTPTLDAIANPAAISKNSGLQTVNLTGITAGPGDTQALQVTATSDNTALIPNPSVTYSSPNATGSIAYTPVANQFGTAHVTVTVRDAGLDGTMGNADDATFSRTFTVTVNDVNQAPTLDTIADPTAINENAGAQTVNLTGISAGPGETQALQVTAASDNTALIPNPSVTYTSPNATGSIAYTPVANKYGTAHVTVTVRDAGIDGVMGNADDATFSRTFTVTVNHVNQTPTLDAIANPAAINENAGVQTVNLTGITAGPGDAQALQVTATSDNTALIPNPSVTYTSPNATGSIAYTPVANAYGTAHVTVTVRDAGLDGVMGNADDATFSRTFTATVNQVNQAPTLDAIADPAAISLNAGLQTVNLTGIAAGPGETQALQVTATSDDATLIPNPTVSYTSPNSSGSITYQPVGNKSGTAHITVTVRDAGLDGILGNADDATFSRTFAATVNNTAVVSLTPRKDNTLIQDATGARSNGTGDVFVGQNANLNLIRRGLLSFDVAGSVPTGATIQSVTLTLYAVQNPGGSQAVDLHKALADWGEAGSNGSGNGGLAQTGDATWLHTFYNTSLWTNPGGDFSSTVSGSQTIGAAGASYTWSSTAQMVADVQGWLNNPSANFGWLLQTNETVSSSKEFASRESATASQRPTLTITYVTNATPTLDAVANPAAINENAGAQTVNLTGISAGPGESQALQVTATSDNTALIPNPSVTYTSPNATGSIVYTPVANSYGTAHVTVNVRDAGLDGVMGNADDATFSRTFTVTVNHVNQTPTLDVIANPAAINENAGAQTVNLTGITAGPGDSQALQVTATSDNTALIPNPSVTYTSPNATGSISYTPVANTYGTAHVTVTVRDAGLDGTLGNADDATFSRTFTVTVNRVNQPPTLGAVADPAAINENSGAQTVNLTGIGAGPGDSQALQVTATSDNTALIPNPTVTYTSPNATGSIAYTPVTNKFGTAHVTVTVRDAGLDGVMGNADDATFARTFTVTVNQINLPPTLDAIANPAAILQDSGLQTVNLTGISAGPGETQDIQVTATSDNTTLIPNPTVNYTTPNATGSITYTPAAGQNGTAHVTVSVRDAGLDGILGNADDGTAARTFTVTVNPLNYNVPVSIVVLNGSVNGAMIVDGTANLNVPGRIAVDSRSATALLVNGTAKITAAVVDVVGGFAAAAGTAVSPAPNAGAVAVADPLAKQAAPTGGKYRGSVTVTAGTRTLNPGVYDRIKASGTARLVLNPGIYIVGGGGFQISGSARVTGKGVMIYNRGGSYASRNGTTPEIAVTQKAYVSLTPPATGPYANLTVFQARADAHPILLSGTSTFSLGGGKLYAAGAKLAMQDGARLAAPLIVNRLEVHGAASETIAAAAASGDDKRESSDDLRTALAASAADNAVASLAESDDDPAGENESKNNDRSDAEDHGSANDAALAAMAAGAASADTSASQKAVSLWSYNSKKKVAAARDAQASALESVLNELENKGLAVL